MENVHITGRFDEDLAKIKKRVLEMGALVKQQLAEATIALGDLSACNVEALIAKDRKINGMNKSIAGRAERLIALRQPMALDLRQALLPINIASELERIGDHAKSTAKRARKIGAGVVPAEYLTVLNEMGDIISTQITDVLTAYENSDIRLAADVRERDHQVDERNKKIFNLSVATLQNGPEDAETLMNLVLVSRNFERVGDHVVNIARHVNQIVTGDDLKASE